MTLFDSLKEKIRSRSRYRVAIDANTNLVTVSKQCEVENELYSVQVPLSAWAAWQTKSQLIQEAMPMLSIEQRCFLLDARTPAEQDRDEAEFLAENGPDEDDGVAPSLADLCLTSECKDGHHAECSDPEAIRCECHCHSR